ncbi:hypothetical protein Q3G72_022391 [Acer saccharum]|nr:hypothetical protein Q3G72_022391 [Acer saccharum]
MSRRFALGGAYRWHQGQRRISPPPALEEQIGEEEGEERQGQWRIPVSVKEAIAGGGGSGSGGGGSSSIGRNGVFFIWSQKKTIFFSVWSPQKPSTGFCSYCSSSSYKTGKSSVLVVLHHRTKLDIPMEKLRFAGMAMMPIRTRMEGLEEICISRNLAQNLKDTHLMINLGLVPLTVESNALGVVRNVDIRFVLILDLFLATVVHSALLILS